MGEGGNNNHCCLLTIISTQDIKTLIKNWCTTDLYVGALLIKETAPVGTRIAKLVVTDRKSSELEAILRFSLMAEKVQKLPIFERLPKRQIMFPGGHQVRADEEGSENDSSDDPNALDIGVPVDPVNRHFAVRIYFNHNDNKFLNFEMIKLNFFRHSCN